MEPLNNDSFGSASVGTGAGGSSVISGGAANNGVAMRDTGDIMLPKSNDTGKKGGKGVIVVLLVVLVLGAVGAAVWAMWPRGGGGETSIGLKRAFNYYANYVLYGTDSDSDISESKMRVVVPYFETNSDVVDEQYLKNANAKFTVLSNNYGDGEANLGDLSIYFQDFAGFKPLSEDEITEIYLNGGAGDVAEEIGSRYETEDTNELLSEYVELKKEIALSTLSTVEKADDAGCLETETETDACREIWLTGEDENYIRESETDSLLARMKGRALSALDIIYNEAYNIESSGEAS